MEMAQNDPRYADLPIVHELIDSHGDKVISVDTGEETFTATVAEAFIECRYLVELGTLSADALRQVIEDAVSQDTTGQTE